MAKTFKKNKLERKRFHTFAEIMENVLIVIVTDYTKL